jgi:uncharacterized RDD family membrane protein YckC
LLPAGTANGQVLFLALVGGFLAAALGTSYCGASPGKLALGLRVVTLQGVRPSLWAALVREVSMIPDGFFFALPAASSMEGSQLKQRFGDKWARTAVVKASSLTPAAAASPGRLAAGLGLNSLISAAFGALEVLFSG